MPLFGIQPWARNAVGCGSVGCPLTEHIKKHVRRLIPPGSNSPPRLRPIGGTKEERRHVVRACVMVRLSLVRGRCTGANCRQRRHAPRKIFFLGQATTFKGLIK